MSSRSTLLDRGCGLWKGAHGDSFTKMEIRAPNGWWHMGEGTANQRRRANVGKLCQIKIAKILGGGLPQFSLTGSNGTLEGAVEGRVGISNGVTPEVAIPRRPVRGGLSFGRSRGMVRRSSIRNSGRTFSVDVWNHADNDQFPRGGKNGVRFRCWKMPPPISSKPRRRTEPEPELSPAIPYPWLVLVIRSPVGRSADGCFRNR